MRMMSVLAEGEDEYFWGLDAWIWVLMVNDDTIAGVGTSEVDERFVVLKFSVYLVWRGVEIMWGILAKLLIRPQRLVNRADRENPKVVGDTALECRSGWKKLYIPYSVRTTTVRETIVTPTTPSKILLYIWLADNYYTMAWSQVRTEQSHAVRFFIFHLPFCAACIFPASLRIANMQVDLLHIAWVIFPSSDLEKALQWNVGLDWHAQIGRVRLWECCQLAKHGIYLLFSLYFI